MASRPIARGNINWKVDGFFENNGGISCREFEIGTKTKTKWQVLVRRCRKPGKNNDQVSIFLKSLETSQVKAKSSLSIFYYAWNHHHSPRYVILKELNSHEADIFNLTSNSWGWENFINVSAIEFLRKSGFVVGCKIEVLSFAGRNHLVPSISCQSCQCSSIEANLWKMYLKSDMTDVELKVKGEVILCHKVVLSAKSKVFKAMFSHGDMLESRTNSVTVDNFSNKCMKYLVEFLYTNKFSLLSDMELTCELYTAADYFDLKELETLCSQHLCKEVNAGNVLRILKVASKSSDDDLMNKCLQILSKILNLKSINGYNEAIGKKDEVSVVLKVCQFFLNNNVPTLALLSNEDCY